MTRWRHLGPLLRGRWFRRLFAVRLVSQFGDGIFQVALASYVLFSPERQPSPEAIAAVLAVVLLPFSVLGPFAGVLLDRWPRRQVLAVANAVRMAVVWLLAALVGAGVADPVFYTVVVGCLSANRFVLAGLSASLPHVVVAEDLVTANALTPTAGAVAALAGAGVGSLLRSSTNDVVVLCAAGVLYGVAAGVALSIPRTQLGPDVDRARPRVAEAVRHVARGMLAGLAHLRDRRRAASGLGVIAAHRFFFGVSTVSAVLLYRNHFHTAAESDAAFADLTVLVGLTGAGFLLAAVLTPPVVERLGPRRWVLVLLVASAGAQLLPLVHLSMPVVAATGLGLGLAAQGIKICVDTLVQLSVDDAFRGRVFSVYDVLFNVAFVAAAGFAAVVLPDDGASRPVWGAVAAGFLATALAYAAAIARPRPRERAVVAP